LFTAEKTYWGRKMNGSVSISIVLGVLASVLIGMTVEAESTDAVPKMTQEQARSVLGNSEVIFIDVRAPRDWDASGSKIKGAVREDPSNIPSVVYP
jgi:LDH2 family malate/lactate/ureidoglycolate dehydrogenase